MSCVNTVAVDPRREATAMAAPVFPSTPEIPVDFTIRKGVHGLTAGDLTVYDARGALVFRVAGGPSSSSARRVKTVFDAAGTPLISAVLHEGGWQGFRGYSWELKDLIFTVQKVLNSPFRTELKVSLAGNSFDDPRLNFILKGSPFQRSCTVYKGNSIIAQTNPMYKLRKFIYSRHKFRLTVYPGTDHALVVGMLVIFFSLY